MPHNSLELADMLRGICFGWCLLCGTPLQALARVLVTTHMTHHHV
jgi:hypothetical protein